MKWWWVVKKKLFDKTKVVKEHAREVIGQPKPTKRETNRKPRLQPDPECFWCYDAGCYRCDD